MYYIDIYYIFKCIHIPYECCLWTVFLPYIKLQIINYIRVAYKIIWINVFIDAFLASYKLFIAKTSQNKNYIHKTTIVKEIAQNRKEKKIFSLLIDFYRCYITVVFMCVFRIEQRSY